MAKKKRANATIGIDEDWQAESDLRTLMEAAEIRKDKKRYAAAQAVARKKMDAMKEQVL